jgi:hypothetical protein
MRASDPILAERRRLGPIEVHRLEAPSLVEAHRALGALVAAPARSAVEKRLAATPPAALATQLASARACRAFLERRPDAPAAVRGALAEYLASLSAWSEAVGLGDGGASAEDLALWAQDDNTGCQTGMLRQRDGSVLLWHTEEDTIGYFDRPRVATLVVGGEARSAFLYPYLVPGPAFGWQRGQIHAVDTLHVRRERTPVGAFTCVASWLIWRLGPEIPAREVLVALAPHVDGCAINVAQRTARGVEATTHEVGGRHVQSRSLPPRAGSLLFQANAVHRPLSYLGREEALDAGERAPYAARARRTVEALALLEARCEPSAEDILRLLASRRGGSYAYANGDVKAHCLARVSAAGIDLHVGSGSAHRDDVARLERLPP